MFTLHILRIACKILIKFQSLIKMLLLLQRLKNLCNFTYFVRKWSGELIALHFWLILAMKWAQKNVLDPVLDITLGSTTQKGSRRERRLAQQYEKSAQRVKIWTRGAYSSASIHSPANFVYTHLDYRHPKEVLKEDRITLMVQYKQQSNNFESLITHGFSKSQQGVNNNCAWFCVTDKKVDVYDLNQFPFVWVAQYLLARELFIVPIWAFLKLAQTDLSDPGSDGREVIMLFNTARCGSTLLCQMFARLPNTGNTI